ncbi:aminopeptidase P family protein [Pedobacter sp.]|jgi:Xaa-Pro aminopeptidase|uniref:aminopeptidase P family protein n=1 Tax=Pedobacter sp. TaxID=1411316 RepID=UPI002C1E23B4|nr:aminopeptidase P family protein [Pedobacter sp.]HWW41322.1 aminopeptidase P family protein [Pedobacter sp.]
MTYTEKLKSIRNQMKIEGIDIYLIPSSDPYQNEYLPEHYRCIEFASGFTGSAGVLVITQDFAGLWTDSRYFIQAEQQLKNSGYQLVKLQIPHTPEYIKWIPKGSKVGCIEELLSVVLLEQLQASGFNPIAADLISPIWNNRPQLPANPAFLLENRYTGQSASEKLNQLRKQLEQMETDAILLSALDEIAWLFNLRGNDIKCNPLTLAYSLVTSEHAYLFIDQRKLSKKDQEYLTSQRITIANSQDIITTIKLLQTGSNLFIDPKRTNAKLFNSIPASVKIRQGISPVSHLKSIKNNAEISNFKKAMIKDGVALTRFMKWIKENLNKIPITELSAAKRLEQFRAEQEGFKGTSFDAISGYAANAALPHYTPNEQSDQTLQPKGLYLIDSGGQYFQGTTDVTRMLILGPLTTQEKEDYTLVLRALIEGTTAQYPTGTRGYQLDAIIRKPLWDKGINYGHGTGHGVGCFLNVHEGPQSISPNNLDVDFKAGMITSIEPGIYRPGHHGVRIENLVITVPAVETEFGSFLSSETLTLALIDPKGVAPELLEPRHLQWLETYNNYVIKTLGPFLSASENNWLKEECKHPN